MTSSMVFVFQNVIFGNFVTQPNQNDPYLQFVQSTEIDDIWTVRLIRIMTIFPRIKLAYFQIRKQNKFILKYLQQTWPSSYFVTFYDTNSTNTPNFTNYIVTENRVLGLSRLRQLRVRANYTVSKHIL